MHASTTSTEGDLAISRKDRILLLKVYLREVRRESKSLFSSKIFTVLLDQKAESNIGNNNEYLLSTYHVPGNYSIRIIEL